MPTGLSGRCFCAGSADCLSPRPRELDDLAKTGISRSVMSRLTRHRRNRRPDAGATYMRISQYDPWLIGRTGGKPTALYCTQGQSSANVGPCYERARRCSNPEARNWSNLLQNRTAHRNLNDRHSPGVTGTAMETFAGRIKSLRADAEQCALIAELATNDAKEKAFKERAQRLLEIAAVLEKATAVDNQAGPARENEVCHDRRTRGASRSAT